MRLRDWLERTHSAGFELRRHFFLRFFDSELISDSSQAKVVAGGGFGILLSLSLIFGQAYYRKYRLLLELPSDDLYRHAVLADVLFLVTLVMIISGLFTTVQWPALFPGLRDYLALAALPVRVGQVFVAKFTALLAVTVIALSGAALPPSIMIPAMMVGRYGNGAGWHVAGIFVASMLGGLFVFFTLVALQGVLLNLLSIRLFPRVSLAIQGLLLALLVAALPFVFSIPALYDRMRQLPSWSIYVPPLWFFAVDQIIFGNREPGIVLLARIAILASLASAAAATLAYLWSYGRHRIRVLESPSIESVALRRLWPAQVSSWFLADPRALGVFAFVTKMLGRSRQHRLILTAFTAISLALISQGFANLALVGGHFRTITTSTEGVRELVIAIPLGFSFFLLVGLRYLFRLPVEIRANWLFRTVEAGHAPALLVGVERFLWIWGALPVAILTLPIEVSVLGTRTGLAAAGMCLFISFLLIEVLLFSFEKIPFTSSYLPGRRPLIETVLKYSVLTACYVLGVAAVVSFAIKTGASTLLLAVTLAAVWWRLRRARVAVRQTSRIEFEEMFEPAVQLLGIERD
jgi:hypothetical protein